MRDDRLFLLTWFPSTWGPHPTGITFPVPLNSRFRSNPSPNFFAAGSRLSSVCAIATAELTGSQSWVVERAESN